MQFHPIRNDDDLARALARVDALWGSAAGTTAGDELEVWLALVEHYEAHHHAIPPGDPIDVIEYKLGELGISQRELGRRLGWGSGRVSEVLGRKRGLTLTMVQQLAGVLGVDPALLVGVEAPRATGERSLELDEATWAAVRLAAEDGGREPAEWVTAVLRAVMGHSDASTRTESASMSAGATDRKQLTREELREIIADMVTTCRSDPLRDSGLRLVPSKPARDAVVELAPSTARPQQSSQPTPAWPTMSPSNDNACSAAWGAQA